MKKLIKKVKIMEKFLEKQGLDDKTKFLLEKLGHNLIDLDEENNEEAEFETD